MAGNFCATTRGSVTKVPPTQRLPITTSTNSSPSTDLSPSSPWLFTSPSPLIY